MANTVLTKAKGTPEAKEFSESELKAIEARKQGKAALEKAKQNQT